jgi:hypothetical protein
VAPAVGFEPTTNRLTADRSTTELRWNVFRISTEGRAYILRTEALAASGNRLIPTLSGLCYLTYAGSFLSRLWERIFACATSRGNWYFAREVSGSLRIYIYPLDRFRPNGAKIQESEFGCGGGI